MLFWRVFGLYLYRMTSNHAFCVFSLFFDCLAVQLITRQGIDVNGEESIGSEENICSSPRPDRLQHAADPTCFSWISLGMVVVFLDC